MGGCVWDEAELKFLRDNYGKILTKDIASVLRRSVCAVKNKALKIGLVLSEEDYIKAIGKLRWKREHEEFLKNNYGLIETGLIAEHLGVSIQSVQRRVQKLGLKMGDEVSSAVYRRKVWTEDDEKVIVDRYSSEKVGVLASELGVSVSVVRKKARKLGLLKNNMWTKEQEDLLHKL